MSDDSIIRELDDTLEAIFGDTYDRLEPLEMKPVTNKEIKGLTQS